MANTQSKIIVFAPIGFAVLLAVLYFITNQNGFVGILASFSALLSAALAVLFWKYGYIFVPMITQKTNVIMMSDEGFEIPPSQDVILKAGNGVYYASCFLGIKIYESVTEQSPDQTTAYNSYFERAISNLKYVTKISYLVFVEDVGEKRKMIETKRAEGQLRLARERDKGSTADVLKIDKYERDVALWDGQLNRLIKGVKPMGIVAYAQTTATGLSKEAAIANSKTQANELKTVLANALNVEVVNLTADEMLKCFEWERFFPTSAQDLEESVM